MVGLSEKDQGDSRRLSREIPLFALCALVRTVVVARFFFRDEDWCSVQLGLAQRVLKSGLSIWIKALGMSYYRRSPPNYWQSLQKSEWD